MISLYTLGGLFYTFAGFSYSLFAIIDISRVKKNKSKYTKKSIKKNEDTTISNVLEEFVA